MTTTARHLTIRGRVQGVGFRQYMVRNARDLHVTGWVRNRADGSVEAVIAGAPDAVRAMLERARRGPPFAEVTDCEVTESHESFAQFDTLPTV